MGQELPPQINTSDLKTKTKGLLTNLSASAGAATKIVAKQAERTKIASVTLPTAYRALGKDCLQQKRHLDCVTELTAQLGSVLAEIKKLSEAAAAQAAPQSITDKAKAAGKQALDVARTKQLGLKRDSLIANIGKSIYEKHREASGPVELVAPIGSALARVSEIETEIGQQSQIGKGTFVTPKRMLIGGAVALVLLIGLGIAGRSAMRGTSTTPDVQWLKPDDEARLKKAVAEDDISATLAQSKALPAKEVSLTPEVKAAVTNVMNYGGRLFVDNAKPDAPIVAVRAFGFGKDMSKLKELKSLEHLDLRAAFNPQRDPTFDAAVLKQFKALKTLALDRATPQDLSHIATIELLETLSFEVERGGGKGVTNNDVLQASLSEVAKVKHLKHLRIGNSGFGFGSHPSDFKAIPTFPELEYLESWLSCDDAALAAISKSTSLKKLVIVFSQALGGKLTFTAKGIADLGNATALSSIQMNDADDSLCESLARLANIKELIVGDGVSKATLTAVASKRPDLRLIKYAEAFQAPIREPKDNWMQTLPANKWRQLMFSKKSKSFLLGPVETNNTETYFD